jgi:hypothetical protein
MKAFNRLAVASVLLACAGCESHAAIGELPPTADSIAAAASVPAEGPRYTPDNRLLLPQNYREWIFLSSGLDMSYSEKPEMAMHSMFDNVFVNPAAWRSFQDSGRWPDKTVLLMEVRGAESKGSINQRGHFQGSEVMGVDVHVRDTARFKDGWAFFAFDSDQPATQIPVSASCYSCHQQHAAVDTTFVQFYPTLLPVAQRKNTLSDEYRHDAHP